MLLIIFDFCRNLSTNTAIELWQKSEIAEYFPAKIIAKNSYEDIATFLINDQSEFTLDCTDNWISINRPRVSCKAPKVNIAYPTLYGDLRSFLFAEHQSEIAEIVAKHPSFQYDPHRQVFTYANADPQELKTFIHEVLSIPDLKKISEFCLQKDHYYDDDRYYLCEQSKIIIHIPNKIELNFKNGTIKNTYQEDILTLYQQI